MKYSVEYSKAAIRDLDRMWAEVFEAPGDYDTTLKYAGNLLDRIEAKAEHPKTGTPLYYEDAFTGYYSVSFKKYIAFYRLEDDAMRVDRILFSVSDYMRTLHIGGYYE